MKIVLCSSVKREIFRIIKHFNADLLKSIRNKYSLYHYSDQYIDIYFIIMGVGHKNVKKNLDYFIKRFKLDNSFLWILTGYTGSLTEDFKIADIIIPDVIKRDEEVYRICPDRFFKIEESRVLFEVPRIYGEREKRELKEKYPDIDIIDMESAAFCEVMKENGFKDYFVYKSITDNLKCKILDFRLIKDSVFKIKFRDFFSVLWRDIRQIKYLFAIYKNMSRASQNIYKFFIEFYEKNKYQ